MRDFTSELAALAAQHLRRELRPLTTAQSPRVEIHGRSLRNFSSNDYLGLANSAELKQILIEGVAQYGAGSGASRLICGTLTPHQQLEEVIAQAKGTEAALTFATGYQAAIGTLTTLLQPGDVAILDKMSHACLIDAAKLSGATIRVFPHNDLTALEKRLHWAMQQIRPDGRVLVITESVFSMDGDLAPLPDLVTVVKKHGALLLVDEAHSFGLYGPHGRGLAAAHQLDKQIDFHFGTLSKAVGLSGGYIAASRPAIDLLINRARSFIYSTAPPPAIAHAAAWVIRDFFPSPAGAARRAQLWNHLAYLAQHLPSPPLPSAIIPLIIGSSAQALDASQNLFNSGFLIPAIRYPTVPRHLARLRLTLTASHTHEDLEALVIALKKLNPSPAAIT